MRISDWSSDVCSSDLPKVPFSLLNKVLTKKEITELIDIVYRHCGQKDTVIFCDRIMTLGFGYACKAGISFGKAHLMTPAAKAGLVEEAQAKVKTCEQTNLAGLIPQGENYNKLVRVWWQCH